MGNPSNNITASALSALESGWSNAVKWLKKSLLQSAKLREINRNSNIQLQPKNEIHELAMADTTFQGLLTSVGAVKPDRHENSTEAWIIPKHVTPEMLYARAEFITTLRESAKPRKTVYKCQYCLHNFVDKPRFLVHGIIHKELKVKLFRFPTTTSTDIWQRLCSSQAEESETSVKVSDCLNLRPRLENLEDEFVPHGIKIDLEMNSRYAQGKPEPKLNQLEIYSQCSLKRLDLKIEKIRLENKLLDEQLLQLLVIVEKLEQLLVKEVSVEFEIVVPLNNIRV